MSVEWVSFTDDEGQTSQFHLYAGEVDTSAPLGLVLYFHGDGGYAFDVPSYVVHAFAERAASSDLLFVAMKTPNRQNGTTWWRHGDANARWVRDLLAAEIFAKYDIDRARVLLVGYSGGAEFNTHFLVAKHSDLFCGGGALMYGGGGRPWAAQAADFDPAFIESFRMHWYTGQDDDGYGTCTNDGYNAYEDAQRGAARYREMGFTVSEEYPPGIDHCNIPFVQVFGEQLAAGLVPAP